MLVRLRLGFPPSCQQMGAPAQTGFPEGVQAHPSQASAPRRGRPAPLYVTTCLQMQQPGLRGGGALAGPGPWGGPRWPGAGGGPRWRGARRRGPLAGPGCCWSCCSPSQPCRSGAGFGSKTEPPPAQLPSVISQLPQLRSSALRVLQGPPPLQSSK